MKQVILNEAHKSCVVAEVAAFVEKIDLDKYAQLKPNDGKLILKVFEDKPGEHKSSGGIITGGTEDKQQVAVVVAAGKGPFNPYTGTHIDMPYSVSDLVFLPEHFGQDIYFGPDREKLMSIAYTDIIAKL